jgi:hypothetical protein
MLCRGGTVVDLSAGSSIGGSCAPADAACQPWRPLPRVRIALAIVLIAVGLGTLARTHEIPPFVDSDYAYMFIAVDRFLSGAGYTSLPPVAPGQPWEYADDWVPLTRWPPGYALILAAIRGLTGWGTLDAARFVSDGACAAALVGWFLLMYRSVPRGVGGLLAALATAGLAVTTGMWLDPSTDLLMVAAMPYVLLMVGGMVRASSWPAGTRASGPLGGVRAEGGPLPHGRTAAELLPQDREEQRPLPYGRGSVVDGCPPAGPTLVRWALCGLACGGLFWIRYASLFVAVGLAVYLAWACRYRRSARVRDVGAFALGACVPVVALVAWVVTRASGGTAQQFNLGGTIGFDISWGMFADAWRNLTDLGYYDYHRASGWLTAGWPVLLGAAALLSPAVRRALRAHFSHPVIGAGAAVVVALLLELLAVTVLFHDKYDYVGEARYYAPVKALYVPLVVGPLLLARRRIVRATVCVGLLIAVHWTATVDWPRPYTRWASADREQTSSGAWAFCFAPGAEEVADWVRASDGPGTLWFSNFHEYVTWETGVAALPPPADAEMLRRWVDRARRLRGGERVCAVFVLNPSNRWRDDYLPEPATLVRSLGLQPIPGAPIGTGAWILQSAPPSALTRR